MKTRTAVLNGKSDAGNPHVRFDEGEVATYPPTVARPERVAMRGAKPRRGSLFDELKMPIMASAMTIALAANAEPTAVGGYSTAHYVQEGLVLCYDGIENAGVGQHDDNPTVWANLGSAGADYDLTLPAWVTPQDGNSFLSKGSTSNTNVMFASVVGLEADKATTIEGVASARWTATDNYNNTQTFVSTSRGALGYRARENGANAKHGFYFGQVHSDGNVWSHDWWINDRYIEDLHTLSLRTVAWSSSTLPFVDGVHAGSVDNGNYNHGKRSYSLANFGNARSDIRICSIRVYNRELTDAEIARNAEVDARRYKGMPKVSSAYVWRRPLEAKVRHDGAYVSLKYGVDDVVRAAYVAWGRADGGENLVDWPNVAYLGTVPAGTTELDGLKLPTEAVQARRVRFFIRYGSISAVQTGLALCYDGVENAGRGVHDAQPTVWKNLGAAGSACDVTLPSWVSVTADGQALLSKGSTQNQGAPTFATVDGIETGKVTTLEVVACGKWTASDSPANLQTIFQTPRGGLGYRSKNTISPHYFYQSLVHADGKVQAHYWVIPSADMSDIHTLSSRTAVDLSSPFLDGENVGTVDSGGSDLGVLANYSLFGNKRSDISIYAIRLYDHALTDAEIARNAEVDRVRFCGESSHGAEGCSICFARVVGLSIIVR